MKYFAAVLSLLLSCFTVIHGDQLKAVVAIVNHGDTIPSKFYPNDPYQDPEIWQKPLGQLSNLGEQQSFAVGQWFLKRYILKNPFISLQYNASQIYTYAEDRDESLMSAECIMAGFLPPVADEIWNRKLPWRPTPVHNAPLFLDYSIGRGVGCPRFEQEAIKVIHGRYYRTHNKEEKNLLQYLTAETGKKFTNIGQIPALYNILQVEQNHNLTLPQWTESVFPELLGKIVLEDSILRTKNPELATLSIGPLFFQIAKQFQDVIDNSPKVGVSLGDIRKFRLFVANSSLIYDTLHALKVPSVGVVPFSATLIFELWEAPEGTNYVKLIYRNSPALHAAAKTLKIGGCKAVKCPYPTFNSTINNFAVNFTQWENLCNRPVATTAVNEVLPAQPTNVTA
ncbi:testicular acid phosphatase homolog [Coccinella septempunctata]|uniref:testicular acid phosphatase homolog n=1 Tax=Coccinella septempunctata TaxID=41139 RepID=UPI001D080361|nr:testicular acid phosphatase homolog [Coccinella septempunctata]